MAAPSSTSAAFLRRNLFGTVCVALSLVLGGASLWLWSRARGLETRNQQRTIEGEETLALLGSGPRLREQNTRAAEAVARIDGHLVTESNLGDNLGLFYRYEEESRARLSDLRQLNSPAVEEGSPYRIVPFSLTLTGTFEQVAQFLFKLETGPQIARIITVNLQRRVTADGSEQVAASVNVNVLARP